MKINIENVIRSGYALAFILVITSYILFFFSLQESREGRRLIYESNLVINTLGNLSSASKDVETGVRGYILTKDSVFLQPTRLGQQNIQTAFGSLDSLIHSNKQLLLLDTVRSRFIERNGLVNNAIAIFNSSGKIFTDSIKKIDVPRQKGNG